MRACHHNNLLSCGHILYSEKYNLPAATRLIVVVQLHLKTDYFALSGFTASHCEAVSPANQMHLYNYVREEVFVSVNFTNFLPSCLKGYFVVVVQVCILRYAVAKLTNESQRYAAFCRIVSTDQNYFVRFC